MKHFLPVTIGLALVMTGAARGAQLPQDHDYQRTLRAYIGGLSQRDLAVELRRFVLPAAPAAARGGDDLCRDWVLSLFPPAVNGIGARPSLFTLKEIEGADLVRRPALEPIPLAWVATWDHPANPYFGSAPLKRRALVLGALDLVMLDGLHERSAGRDWLPHGLQKGKREGRAMHSDRLGGALIWIAYVYAKCKDVLPADARAAYETGLKKMVRRLDAWGPDSLMTDMDLFASVALAYVADAVDDPEITRIAETYSRFLYTHPRYFDPAGYWVDIQGYDASYTGISFYFGTWAALAGWDFATDAVGKAYRLRSHMALPEPDGATFAGPSHFSPRTSADSYSDQWGWYYRKVAGALATDEAAHLMTLPPEEELAGALARVVAGLNASLKAGAKTAMAVWRENAWVRFNYPYLHYPKGFYERRRKLERDKSPLLVPAFQRDENFVRRFGDAFLVAKFPRHGVIIHTGPVGTVEADWPTRTKWMPMSKPFGFSGGQLSAFWTPKGGPVLLGRRGGAQGSVYDKWEDWRTWPFHAVSGETVYGATITSGRILKPDTSFDVRKDSATVRVSGVFPHVYLGQEGRAMEDDLHYARTFHVSADGVKIRTEVRCEPTYRIAELCETLPVFVGLGVGATPRAPVAVHVTAGGKRAELGTDYIDGVAEIGVRRHKGTVVIRFTDPQRVKLSPREWQDGYQSRAICRTILIDLMRGKTRPFTGAAVEYLVAPERE